MTRSGVTQCSWNSPAPSAGNTGFYLSRSVSAKQSSWPGNPIDYRVWRLMQERAYIVQDTCPRHERLDATHQWHMGKHNHKTSKLSVNGVVWMREGKRTSLWTSAKLTMAFSEPPTVYRGKRVISRPFHRSYLKANKMNNSEGIKKFENAYHFWKCADAVYEKL